MEVTYDIQQIFIERLKELIADKRFNIKEFSKKSKIPSSTISDWLNMKTSPNMYNIVKMAIFFGVTTDYLLGLEN